MTPKSPYDVAVVGSGFAGSILARVLAAAGRSVLLVERGRHPRFALGESSTPLAAIALERLARRLEELGADGTDLRALAAAGRWRRHLDPPAGRGCQDRGRLGRGLKRGFTFYRHHPGVPYANSADNDARLLVAASPLVWLAEQPAELVRGEGCELLRRHQRLRQFLLKCKTAHSSSILSAQIYPYHGLCSITVRCL